MHQPPEKHGSSREYLLEAAFTLVELLTVIAVIAVLLALVVPVFTKSAGDLTKAAYEIQGALNMARTYAVANRTYVWVGFFEEDLSRAGATPAVSGVGQLVVSTVASRDGTCVYDPLVANQGTTAQTLPAQRLVQIGKLLKMQNVHVYVPDSSTDRFGQRPGNHFLPADGNKHRVGLGGAGQPLFSFSYPLGDTAQYVFGIYPTPMKNGVAVPSGVVQFNPQGEAISETGPVPGVVPCKEIAIQPTHGNVPASGPDAAAVDIAGLTGQATIYRR